MAKPYSMDLRDRVVRAVAVEGMSRHSAAARFGVAPSSTIKWMRRYREMGSAAPSRIGGRRSNILSGVTRDWLLERATSDFTLPGLVGELAKHGVTMCRCGALLMPRGQASKKSELPAEQLRPAIVRRRAQWKKYRGRLDPDVLP